MGKVLLLSLLIFSSSLYAEQNTKQQKIDELISVMNLDSMVDSMYGQVEGMMKGMSDQMGVKPSEQAIFDKYYGDMTTVLKTEMSWAKMQPMMVNVYDKHFSEQEIADMLAFYKTDTGQKILEKMPVVMQESMQMSQSLMKDAMPKIQTLAQQLSDELEQSRSESN
ncbi:MULTISPECIES: DUF2059 domain-containing protein [Pseudoalteromonas]|jgi:hypothetical protein|uniref:DUF2059 domain-containing protein n=1 Tax=Pseudoalteromonas TaxID=53246 RepID=UPI0004275C46|nr:MULTISPECIES: DUF2059 domain-containing protein [Pseudoalteromonas]MBB1277782.1 DUF2059 domain-containing protein [Pseudoalteromonas sp. SR43-3]MBB1297743.1 DUF2059 domain-containing protein [Pseudoalteromonas sp. SR41-7]MBB1305171.1 DUF2059 domain-containing protein [Pseudoalteromonas sp. SR43-5]MBB1400445.1 DUF2059 domain-containing protein [Pseudoalteromonas sp. SG45-1]MBB1430270.1 DUF2059 domain-containing protein [Pseudoalteromonas sp. SG43-4]|tara:strand:- start:678 stop:1175 length:498 start_codon:yes stop_codon:yes gene_type:complete